MDRRGYFQMFGGQYMPESLMNALADIEKEHLFVAHDQCFTNELDFFCNMYGGRKTPLYKARLVSKKYGPDIFFKREDLLPYGGSSFMGILGQMIISKRIGRKVAVIACYNPAHGCMVSAFAAAMDMKSEIYIAENDLDGHTDAFLTMKMNNADIHIVNGDYQAAYEEAIKRWKPSVPEVCFVQPKAAGPYPFPLMVREYQKVMGTEIKEQMKEYCEKLPEAVICASGYDAADVGAFYEFIEEEDVKLVAVERADHATITQGEKGIGNGMRSFFLLDEEDNCKPGVLADGRSYPMGCAPEIASLVEKKRVEAVTVTEEEAIQAAIEVANLEGIFIGEESAYAVAHALKIAGDYRLDQNLVVVLSGSADENWMKKCLIRKENL